MRIAVNTRFLMKGKIEGMGLFTKEVLKILVKQHPEDDFIFFFDRKFDSSFIFDINVTPVVLFPPARHPFLFVWWYEWSVRRALEKYRADVFLSPDNFLSLTTPAKTVLVTHDLAYLHFKIEQPFFQKKYYEFFSPRFNRRADHIVTVSHFSKNDIIGNYGIGADKISVACNGCGEDFVPLNEAEKKLTRSKYAGGQPYFFYVGSIHPRKNVHRLVKAFDEFKKSTSSPIKLLIAGRMAWKSGVVRTAFEEAVHKYDIHFLGYVGDNELPKLMASSFACTYVSMFEGFGIPLLQAMHCEVPIITSNISSMPEIAGRAAILVDPRSVNEIANAMQQISANPHLYSSLVAHGRLQRRNFTWQRAADVVYDALLKLNAS